MFFQVAKNYGQNGRSETDILHFNVKRRKCERVPLKSYINMAQMTDGVTGISQICKKTLSFWRRVRTIEMH